MNQQHDKHGHKVVKNEHSGTKPTGKLDFAYQTIVRLEDKLNRILTAAKCNSVEEVVNRLESIEHLESQVIKLLGVAKCGNVLEVVKLLTKPTPTDEEIGKIAENIIGKPFAEMSEGYQSWYYAFIRGYKEALTPSPTK